MDSHPPAQRADGRTRVKVAVVADARPALGGISTFAEWLASDPPLAELFDITLVNTTRRAVWRGGAFSLRNVWRSLADAVRVFRVARAVDIVHIQTALMPTGPLLRAAALSRSARTAGARVICHVHTGLVNVGPYESFEPTRVQRALLRILGADRVVAVSNAGYAGLARVVPRFRLVLIENGIDATTAGSPAHRPAKARDRETTLLYAGALGESKGLLDLLDAMLRLRRRDLPAWRLQVVGGPNQQGAAEAERIRAAFSAAGLAGAFTGPLGPEDLRAMLGRADVLVLPSHYEGQPLVVLEAMAAGLPVVATHVGGLPDMLRDGVDGLVVAPRDPAALADALDRFIRSPEERRAMGRSARARVRRNYSMERLREQLTELYDSVLAG